MTILLTDVINTSVFMREYFWGKNLSVRVTRDLTTTNGTARMIVHTNGSAPMMIVHTLAGAWHLHQAHLIGTSRPHDDGIRQRPELLAAATNSVAICARNASFI